MDTEFQLSAYPHWSLLPPAFQQQASQRQASQQQASQQQAFQQQAFQQAFQQLETLRLEFPQAAPGPTRD